MVGAAYLAAKRARGRRIVMPGHRTFAPARAGQRLRRVGTRMLRTQGSGMQGEHVLEAGLDVGRPANLPCSNVLVCGYANNAGLVGAMHILAQGHRVVACGNVAHSGPLAKQEPAEATAREVTHA